MLFAMSFTNAIGNVEYENKTLGLFTHAIQLYPGPLIFKGFFHYFELYVKQYNSLHVIHHLVYLIGMIYSFSLQIYRCVISIQQQESDIRFDCLFLGCHCTDFELVPVPLLPGLDVKHHRFITHDMLDILLWLPHPKKRAVVIDPVQSRLQKIVFNDDDKRYYQYTLIYLDQVTFHTYLHLYYHKP